VTTNVKKKIKQFNKKSIFLFTSPMQHNNRKQEIKIHRKGVDLDYEWLGLDESLSDKIESYVRPYLPRKERESEEENYEDEEEDEDNEEPLTVPKVLTFGSLLPTMAPNTPHKATSNASPVAVKSILDTSKENKYT